MKTDRIRSRIMTGLSLGAGDNATLDSVEKFFREAGFSTYATVFGMISSATVKEACAALKKANTKTNFQVKPPHETDNTEFIFVDGELITQEQYRKLSNDLNDFLDELGSMSESVCKLTAL